MDARSSTLVIPCYNEEHRFLSARFTDFLTVEDRVHLLFVNDGSTDGTLARLQAFCAEHPGRATVLDLQPNGGKGEAVRRGLLHALAIFPGTSVGFWDADLATPLEAFPEFLEVLDADPKMELVFGARVRLLGRHVMRNPMRHYAGRAFATTVSTSLGLPIYDTQCGAKLFRCSPLLHEVLSKPFQTRWIFDVELLSRFLAAWHVAGLSYEGRIYELPLKTWVDVAGSKVKPSDFVRSFVDLLKIRKDFARRSRS
jgi:dolichyl-phosphate beta-glucosyltransferase